MSDEAKHEGHGCAVCNTQLARPTEDILAERRAAFAESIEVIPDGDHWAVIELHPNYPANDHRKFPIPELIYTGMETREAAELARDHVVNSLAEDDARHVYAEVPGECFFEAGRILAWLRKRNVPDAEELANALSQDRPWAAAPPHSAAPADIDGIPF